MKKKTHTSPMEYRVRYIINGSTAISTQYYNVFHSSEAINFFAHTWRQGHVDGSTLRILAVEEFERFSHKWIDRTSKALDHTSVPELSTEGEVVWLRRKI